MRYLDELEVGEKFRPAYEGQVSRNGIPVQPNQVFVVEKIYPMNPKMRICRLVRGKDARIRSFMPKMPVLRPTEPAPSREQVEAFLLGKRRRRAAFGYSMAWEGEDVSCFLQPQELKVLTHLRLSGRRTFLQEDLTRMLAGLKLEGSLSAKQAFNHYARHYCELGLMVPIVDERPPAAKELRENLGAM